MRFNPALFLLPFAPIAALAFPTPATSAPISNIVGQFDNNEPSYRSLCPEGFSGTLLNDDYIGMSCQRSDGTFLLLKQFLGNEPNGDVISKFVHAFHVPRNSRDETIITSAACNRNNSDGDLTNLYPLIKTDADGNYTVLNAWQANFETETFDRLSPQELAEITCEPFYP